MWWKLFVAVVVVFVKGVLSVAVHSCHASAGFYEHSMVIGGWAEFCIILRTVPSG